MEHQARSADADAVPHEPTGPLHDTLHALEERQVRNALAPEQGEPLHLDVPLAWGGAATAHLLIQQDRPEGGASQGRRRFHVATVVDLDGLGLVRTDIDVVDRHVTIRLLCDRDETERTLAEFVPRLTDRLGAAGYRLNRIVTGVGAQNVLREPARQAGLPPPRGSYREVEG
jgi:hypothetical protein